MTETVEGHHRFNGHEFGQTPGDGEGQGSLVCCSPWGHRESDMTWQLNNNHNGILYSSENGISYMCQHKSQNKILE